MKKYPEVFRYPLRYDQKRHLEKNYFKFSETSLQLLSSCNSKSHNYYSTGNFKETTLRKYLEKIRV